jgi:hypothetical protein
LKLKLSEIASIAEVVGAIAVVISLLYVGAQVRDSTRAVRSVAANDANSAMQSWYQMMSSDPQAIDIWLEAILSPEPLSRNDEFRFMMIVQSAMLAMQNSFLLAREGSLDRGIMSSITEGLQATKHTPGFQRYWRQRRGYFYPEFAVYIDDLVASEDSSLDTVDVYREAETAP